MKYFKKYYGTILVVSTSKTYYRLIEDALDFIKKRDISSFRKILRCLKVIFIPATRGYLNGTYERNRAWIVEGEMLKNNALTFVASLLIHETHHVSQYLSGHKYKLPASEIRALGEQKKFLKKIKDASSLQWLEKELKRKWWKDVVGNTKSTTRLDNYLEILKKDKYIK